LALLETKVRLVRASRVATRAPKVERIRRFMPEVFATCLFIGEPRAVDERKLFANANTFYILMV
jgi:hypothetical protein